MIDYPLVICLYTSPPSPCKCDHHYNRWSIPTERSSSSWCAIDLYVDILFGDFTREKLLQLYFIDESLCCSHILHRSILHMLAITIATSLKGRSHLILFSCDLACYWAMVAMKVNRMTKFIAHEVPRYDTTKLLQLLQGTSRKNIIWFKLLFLQAPWILMLVMLVIKTLDMLHWLIFMLLMVFIIHAIIVQEPMWTMSYLCFNATSNIQHVYPYSWSISSQYVVPPQYMLMSKRIVYENNNYLVNYSQNLAPYANVLNERWTNANTHDLAS